MEEIIQKQDRNEQVIQVTSTVKQDIICAAKWGKFFGILTYITAGLTFIVAICSLFVKSKLDMLSDEFEDLTISSYIVSVYSIILFFCNLITAIICIILAHYLFKASNNILKGINQDSQDKIAIGTHSLKLFCLICGVITIILWAVGIFTFFGGLFASILSVAM